MFVLKHCMDRINRFRDLLARVPEDDLVNLTRLWNWADHQPECELYWEYMLAMHPQFFRDRRDPNSALLCYEQRVAQQLAERYIR